MLPTPPRPHPPPLPAAASALRAAGLLDPRGLQVRDQEGKAGWRRVRV